MIHDHTLGGLKNAPDLISLTKKVAVASYSEHMLKNKFDLTSEEISDLVNLILEGKKAKQKVLNFAVKLQNTWCDDIRLSEPARPMGTKFEDVKDLEEDFIQFQNVVHRHVCSKGYCLRLNKKNGEWECRLPYPSSLSDVHNLHILWDDKDGRDCLQKPPMPQSSLKANGVIKYLKVGYLTDEDLDLEIKWLNCGLYTCKLVTKRNDPRLNIHNRVLTQM